MICIYALQCPKTNKFFYIGKTNNILKRFTTHLKMIDSNFKKNRIIKSLLKEGLTPIFSILEIVSEDVWENREKFYIKKYKKHLTNMTPGGDNPPVNTRVKKVSKLSIEGIVLKTWPNSKAASKDLHKSRGMIQFLCTHNSLLNKKYILMYNQDLEKNGFTPYKNYHYKCGSNYIYTIYQAGIKIKELNNLKEVSLFTKDSSRTISRLCKSNKVSRRNFSYKRKKKLSLKKY